MLDIAAEQSAPNEAEIRTLQAMKTGALLAFACEAGAVLGSASPDQRKSLKRYGETIGLAFQLADDLLDITSNAQQLGKAVGKDAEHGKGTLIGIHGLKNTQAILKQTVVDAETCLTDFGAEADTLRQTAQFVMTRSS